MSYYFVMLKSELVLTIFFHWLYHIYYFKYTVTIQCRLYDCCDQLVEDIRTWISLCWSELSLSTKTFGCPWTFVLYVYCCGLLVLEAKWFQNLFISLKIYIIKTFSKKIIPKKQHVSCIYGHGCVIPSAIYVPKGLISYHFVLILMHPWAWLCHTKWQLWHYLWNTVQFFYYVWFIYVCGCISPRGSYGPKGVIPYIFLITMFDSFMDLGVLSQREDTDLRELLLVFLNIYDALVDEGVSSQEATTEIRG